MFRDYTITCEINAPTSSHFPVLLYASARFVHNQPPRSGDNPRASELTTVLVRTFVAGLEDRRKTLLSSVARAASPEAPEPSQDCARVHFQPRKAL